MIADEYPKPHPISKIRSLEFTFKSSNILAKILGSNKYLSSPKCILVSQYAIEEAPSGTNFSLATLEKAFKIE